MREGREQEVGDNSNRVYNGCNLTPPCCDRLQGAFAAKLAASGYDPQRSAELAAFITAAFEGGILLSRTYHSGDPLRRVGQELAGLLAA